MACASAASTTCWCGSRAAATRCRAIRSSASSRAVAESVLDRERLIDVEWDVEEPGKRPVRIAVYIGKDRPGLLSEITGAISARNGNITKAEVTVTDDRRGINNFVVEVADLRQLQDIIAAIRDVRDVINVERVRGL